MSQKKIIILFIRMTLVFTCLVLFPSFPSNEEIPDTTLFFESLHEAYGNDYEKILNEVEQNLNSTRLNSYERGQNLLAYLRYNRLLFNYDVVLNSSEYVENYLQTYDMDDELLYLYSIVTNTYRLTESTKHMSYLYMYKGEELSKKIFKKEPNNENLMELLAIMYLKSVSALEIHLYDEADITFKEARTLHEENQIEESLEICDSIFTYNFLKKNYSEALIHGKTFLDGMYNIAGQEHAFTRNLIRMGFIYIELGDFDKATDIINYLNTQTFQLSTTRQIEKGMLEACIFLHNGEDDKSLKSLLNTYEISEPTKLYTHKIAIIDMILEHYTAQKDMVDVNYWLNNKLTIIDSTDTFEKEQVLLSKLVDADLTLAGSRINLLKTQQTNLVSAIIIVILLFLMLISYFIYVYKRKTFKNKLLENSLENMDAQLHYQFQHYESIKEYQSYVRKLWHDLKNHQILLLSFIQNHEYEEAKQYIQGFNEQIEKYEQTQICNHKVIDALLSFKIKMCTQKNIKLFLDINLPENIGIDNFTSVTILGNLFDNAIEACDQIDTPTIEKYIKLDMHVKQNYLIIQIENSKNHQILTHKNHILTTKQDKLSHGLGLQSVQDCVKKYDGIFKTTYSDTMFSVNIIINSQAIKSG